MPAMPLEVKLAVVAIVALLVGLIVLYHVWVERRTTASLAPRPGRVASTAAGPRSDDDEAQAAGRRQVARHGARKR
jgi:hypothetical protein